MSNRSSPRGNRQLASTFITEMDSYSHANNSNKSARRSFNTNSTSRKKSNLPRISGSQSMFTSSFGRADPNAPIEFDQGKLDHAYELLVKEIMDLKRDISPIRHTYLKLKDRLLFQRQCLVNSNENFLLSEQFPDLSNAIGDGGTFSGLIEEFQIEIDDNTNIINDLKNRFSSYWTVKLSCENDKERDELIAMKEMLNNLKSKKKKLTNDLMQIKQSANIQKIDNQRKKMHKLILDIAKAEQRNQKLEKSLQTLEKEFDLETPSSSSSSSILVPLSNNSQSDTSTNKVKFVLGDSNNDTNTNKNNTNKTNNNNNSNDKSKYSVNFMSTPEAQAAFDEVEAFEKELAEKRQKYLLKCDEFIVIRNKQLKQLQDFELKHKEKFEESEIKDKNSEQKKFNVKEPKKPPSSSGRARKSPNSKKTKKENSSSNKIESNKNENKSTKMSNEELISHLMGSSQKSKNDEEELQEIPIEDESSNEDGNGGIQIEDAA